MEIVHALSFDYDGKGLCGYEGRQPTTTDWKKATCEACKKYSSMVVISDEEILKKLEILVAEYTSGMRNAIPEQEDRDYAKGILDNLEKRLRD